MSNLQQRRRGFWMVVVVEEREPCWEVTLRLCVRAECELSNCPPVHFSCFPLRSETKQVEVPWGMQSGWLGVKGSLSAGRISWMFWEASMETGGRLGGPLLPLGSWRCQSKEKGERESEHRMCWACPVLISVKNKPPSQLSHSAAPACTQVDSAALWGNAPIWQGRGDKSKRGGMNMISCQATLKLIFMY